MNRDTALSLLVALSLLLATASAPAQDRDRERPRASDPDRGLRSDPDRPSARARHGDIYGYEMMSSEEREAYRARMRAARSAEERERIRAEHRARMQARARERGVSPPEESRSGGPGLRGGAGPRGPRPGER